MVTFGEAKINVPAEKGGFFWQVTPQVACQYERAIAYDVKVHAWAVP
jgi:hypothetical protein